MHESQLIDEAATATESPSLATWRGPLFLVGMFRSGTSLLYALLNQHPDIALMFEAEFFRITPLFWRPRGSRNWMSKCDFWNQVFQRHALDPDRISFDSDDLRSNVREVYQEYARQKGALIWGDKSPNYHDYLNHLAGDFPEAKFVIIWRDPLAICRSIARAAAESHWFDRIGTTHRTLLGYRRMKAECDELVRKGISVHQVQYEDLVRDPVQTMKGICTFLGVTFVPAMASLKGADRSAIYDNGLHSQVRGERVVARAERPEVLSQRAKSKIQRYVSLWRQESGGTWPVSEVSREGECGEPSIAERTVDRIWYSWLGAFDSLVTSIYFFAPRPPLKLWRKFRHRHPSAGHQDSRLSG